MEGESDKEVDEPVGERTFFFYSFSDHASRIETSQHGVVGITRVYLHI